MIFGILTVHEQVFLGANNPNSRFLLADTVVSDERVFTSLVLVYISPETASNQELRQCLSYFFPVYAYSSAANQDRMRRVSVRLCYRYVECELTAPFPYRSSSRCMSS